jgi:hypothetical protein
MAVDNHRGSDQACEGFGVLSAEITPPEKAKRRTVGDEIGLGERPFEDASVEACFEYSLGNAVAYKDTVAQTQSHGTAEEKDSGCLTYFRRSAAVHLVQAALEGQVEHPAGFGDREIHQFREFVVSQ